MLRISNDTTLPPDSFYSNLDSLFKFDPKIADSRVPMKECLKPSELKPAENGKIGKVRFVQFKEDPQSDRWFAIKRQFPCKTYMDKLDMSVKRDCFFNSYAIAQKLAGHPSFMRVYGVVDKVAKDGLSKTYLIMDYLNGEPTDEVSLTFEQKKNLLHQVKDAVMHLAKRRINPGFVLGTENSLITADYKLKFIDFDFWKEDSSSFADLAHRLYEFGHSYMIQIAKPKDLIDNWFTPIKTEKDLEDSLGNLIKNFAEIYR